MTPNIPNEELNSYVGDTTSNCFPPAKKWQRVDVGNLETYIGDDTYVITLIEQHPRDVEEMNENCDKVQNTVIHYLQGEGFIGKEYLYIGLQKLDLKNLPDGLQ